MLTDPSHRGSPPTGKTVPGGLVAWLREAWYRLRAWRRIHFTRAGVFFTLGAFAVGFGAINTGNNLLYLLLGAMLGAMAASGWLSEQTLRSLEVVRSVPTGVPVHRDVTLRYRVRNGKRRLTSFAVELQEPGLQGIALLPRIRPGERAEARSTASFQRRGVYAMESLTLATEFPFGLFRKERDIDLPGELVVWPRTDRRVPQESLGVGRDPTRHTEASSAAAGARGEFRSLREYRFGDDARDIHWRTSARLRRPVVREYERDSGDALWIVLDTCQAGSEEAREEAVEVAASLCAAAARRGRPFALAAGPYLVDPGSGPRHLERSLDALARVEFLGSGTRDEMVPRHRAVQVTAGSGEPGFASVVRIGGGP